MNQKANVAIVILALLAFITLALAGAGFYLFQKERERNINLEDKLEEINAKQRITETRFEESKKIISDLQVKLDDARSQIDTLSKDLEQEKTARLEATAKIEQFRLDLDQQKSLRSDLEKRLGQAQDDLKKAKGKLDELESKRAELVQKVNELESKSEVQGQGVELGKIVVGSEGPKTEEPKGKKAKAYTLTSEKKEIGKEKVTQLYSGLEGGLEGKILVINREFNFAIINLGNKDGVSMGSLFSIYHNNKYIGDVKVEKLQDSMSAASFVSPDIKDKISEGDKVVQKVK